MSDTIPAKPKTTVRFARELTTLVAIFPLIWIVGWSPATVFSVVMAIVAALALYEFLVLGRKKGYDLPIPLCIAIMLFIVASFVRPEVSVEVGVFATLLLIPSSYVFSKLSLDDALPSSAVAVLATLYVGMLAGSMVRLRHDFRPEGPRLVFFLLIVVWIADAGAYYAGRAFGKHKLSPRISPKKTIEGLIGGIITSVVAAVIISMTFLPEMKLLHAVVIAIILSFAGVVGDLAESMWKRSADVKDSGTLIPGHGGFLDRFDSIFFTAPILYLYWAFTHEGVKTLNIIKG